MRAICDGEALLWARRLRWDEMRICLLKLLLFQFSALSSDTFKQKLSRGEYGIVMNACVKCFCRKVLHGHLLKLKHCYAAERANP